MSKSVLYTRSPCFSRSARAYARQTKGALLAEPYPLLGGVSAAGAELPPAQEVLPDDRLLLHLEKHGERVYKTLFDTI